MKSFTITNDYQVNNIFKTGNRYYGMYWAFAIQTHYIWGRGLGATREIPNNSSFQTKQIFAIVLTLSHLLKNFIMTIKKWLQIN